MGGEMKLIGATFSNETFTVTLFRQDIERLDRICNVPAFLAADESRRFAEDMVKRAVFNDTGEPVIGC